jgi:hypothetical protein
VERKKQADMIMMERLQEIENKAMLALKETDPIDDIKG